MQVISELLMLSSFSRDRRPTGSSLLTFSGNRRLLTGLVLTLFVWAAMPAAAQDTLWARNEDNNFLFSVKAKRGDNANTIAARFHAPIMEISRQNHITLQSEFQQGAMVNVPVGKYNHKRAAYVNTLPLYYRIKEGDRLQTLSRMVNVSQSTIQAWNNLNSQDLTPGHMLLLGWITDESLFDEPENLQGAPSSKTPPIANHSSSNTIPDRIIADNDNPPEEPMPEENNTEHAYKALDETQYFDSVSAAMEQQYDNETNGLPVTEESGPAVFFDYKKVKPGFFYAFHNTAVPGSLIRIFNPASGDTVYAKVIGPIPPLKEYEKCIIAVSGNASRALGTPYKTVFCKVTFR